jgi:hypothetical protein
VPIIPGRRQDITDKEKDARDARLDEAAKARSKAIEDAQIAEIHSVWDRIPADIRRIFNYIDAEIPKRELASDVKFLRETRELHFRPFRRYLKEDPSA